jgi:hypothetical protein
MSRHLRSTFFCLIGFLGAGVPGGGLEIRVEAPECVCALTGIVLPAPAQ